jgi:hypothetical protein
MHLFLLGLLRILWHTDQPVEEHCFSDVKCNLREDDAVVAPPLAVVRANGCQGRISRGHRAELTIRQGIVVTKVATSGVAAVFHVI